MLPLIAFVLGVLHGPMDSLIHLLHGRIAQFRPSYICGTLIGVQQGLLANWHYLQRIFGPKLGHFWFQATAQAIYMISVRPYVSVPWMDDSCMRQLR